MLLSDEIERSPEKFDCNVCRERKYYLSKNCDGSLIPSPNITDEEVKFIIDQNKSGQISLQFCPAILFHDEEVMELVELYSLYKDGFLLTGGGVENQPYWYIQAMLELKAINNYIEKKELEKANG